MHRSRLTTADSNCSQSMDSSDLKLSIASRRLSSQLPDQQRSQLKLEELNKLISLTYLFRRLSKIIAVRQTKYLKIISKQAPKKDSFKKIRIFSKGLNFMIHKKLYMGFRKMRMCDMKDQISEKMNSQIELQRTNKIQLKLIAMKCKSNDPKLFQILDDKMKNIQTLSLIKISTHLRSKIQQSCNESLLQSVVQYDDLSIRYNSSLDHLEVTLKESLAIKFGASSVIAFALDRLLTRHHSVTFICLAKVKRSKRKSWINQSIALQTSSAKRQSLDHIEEFRSMRYSGPLFTQCETKVIFEQQRELDNHLPSISENSTNQQFATFAACSQDQFSLTEIQAFQKSFMKLSHLYQKVMQKPFDQLKYHQIHSKVSQVNIPRFRIHLYGMILSVILYVIMIALKY